MLIIEVLFYAASHLLGIVVGSKLFFAIEMESLVAPEPVSISSMLFAFLIATLLFFLLLKTKKRVGGIVVHGLFVVGLFVGLETALSVFIGDAVAVIVTLVLLMFHFRHRTVLGHNLLFLGAMGGIGGVLGVTISLRDAAILLAVLAVYDIIAVYVTRHMVVMAEGMLRTGAMFGVVLPRRKELWLQPLAPLAKEKLKTLRDRSSAKERSSSTFFLGGGDVALPMILVVAALQKGLQASFILLGFTIAGFIIMQVLFSRLGHERPMPALPPLAGMALLGLLFI